MVESSRAANHQLMGRYSTMGRWFVHTPLRTLSQSQRAVMLDLQSISWILQTSLDKAVRLLAFRHLIAMPELSRAYPALVVDCFNVVVIQGLERLATASVSGFFPISPPWIKFRVSWCISDDVTSMFPFQSRFHGFPVPFDNVRYPCFGQSIR